MPLRRKLTKTKKSGNLGSLAVTPETIPPVTTATTRARSDRSSARPPRMSLFQVPTSNEQNPSDALQKTRERSFELQGYKAQAVQQQLQDDIVNMQVNTAMKLLAILTWFVKELSGALMVRPVNAPDFEHIEQHAIELQGSIEDINPSREAPTQEQLLLLKNINATIKNYFVTLQKFVNQKIKVLNRLGNEDSEKITPNLTKFMLQISDYLEIMGERDVLDQKRILQEKHGYVLRYCARSAQEDYKIVSKVLSGENYQPDFFERTIYLDSKVDIEELDQYTNAIIALMRFVEAYSILTEAAHDDLSKPMDSTIRLDDRAPKEWRAIAFVLEKIIKGNLVAKHELERAKNRAKRLPQQAALRQVRASIGPNSGSRFHVEVGQYQQDDERMLRYIQEIQKKHENREVYVLAFDGVDNTWLLCRAQRGPLEKVMVREIPELRDFNKSLEEINYSNLKNDDKADLSTQVLLYLKAGKTYNKEDIRLLQELVLLLKRAAFYSPELEGYRTDDLQKMSSSEKPKALQEIEVIGVDAAELILRLSSECKLSALSSIIFDAEKNGVYEGLRLLKHCSGPFKEAFLEHTIREMSAQKNNGGSNNGHASELPDLISELSDVIYLSPLSGAMRFDSCAQALVGQDDLNAFRKNNTEEYLLFLINFIRKGNKFTRINKSSGSRKMLKRAVKEDLTDPGQMLERVHFAYGRLEKMGANSTITQYKSQEGDALQLAAVHKGILQRDVIQEAVDSGQVVNIFSALVDMVRYVMTTEFKFKNMGAEDSLPVLISIFFNYFLSDKNVFRVIATVLKAFENGQNNLLRLNLPCYHGYLNLASADQYMLVSMIVACQATIEHIGKYNSADKVEINEIIGERASEMQAAMEQFIVENALDQMILGYSESKKPSIFKHLDEIYVMLDRVSKKKASSTSSNDFAALPSYIAPRLMKDIVHALEVQNGLVLMDQLTPSDCRKVLCIVEYLLNKKIYFKEVNLHIDLFKHIIQRLKENSMEKSLNSVLEALAEHQQLSFSLEIISFESLERKIKRDSSRGSKSDDITSVSMSATDRVKGPARKLHEMLKSKGLLDDLKIIAELEEIHLVLKNDDELSQAEPAKQIKALLLEMQQKVGIVSQKEEDVCMPDLEAPVASAPSLN